MPVLSRPVRAVLVAPILALAGLMVWLHFATHPAVFLDTFDVLDGVGAASGCLRHSVLTNCGSGVGRFALLQYLPGLAFHALGMSYNAGLHGLVAVNGFAFAGVVGLVALVARRVAGRATAALGAAVILAAPLLWYSHSGYGEALATFALTLFTAAVVLGWPPAAIAAATVLAGINKETAPPFLLVIALIAWRLRRGERPAGRAEVVTVAAGVVAAVLINGGFDIFRYGTFTNPDYTDPALKVPLVRALEGFAGQLVSPTYGLLWVWPAALVVLGITAALVRRGASLRQPGTAIVVTFLALVASFALHYAPYGGTTSTGPRLLLPWVPAFLILCVAAHPARFERAAAASLRSWRALALTLALLVVTGLPNLIVMVDSSRWQRIYPGLVADRHELIIYPVVPDALCPVEPARLVTSDPDYYYRCLQHEAWDKGVRPVAAYAQLPRARELIFAVAWTLALGALLLLGRARVVAQPPTRA